MTDETYVEHAWFRLMNELKVGRGESALWFMEIRDAYRDRPYHNLGHLRMCLELIDQRKTMLNEPNMVIFSIFFHDLVLKPGSKKNEIASAEQAKLAVSQLKLGKMFARKVHEMIVLTSHFEPEEDFLYDVEHLLDVDLAILESSGETYDAYSRGIREEYAHVSDEEFYPARLKVLKDFIGRKKLYRTLHFKERFHTAALANMEREVGAITVKMAIAKVPH